MGCDIHIFVETMRHDKWSKIGYVFEDPYACERDIGKHIVSITRTDEPYTGRNYKLFSILADVRNVEDGIIPINTPRDLPKDVTDEIKEISDSWGCDGHSHSYLTVRELLDYDWEVEEIERGTVSENDYIAFKKDNNVIPSYCGSTARTISNEDMDLLISGKLQRDKKLKYHTEISWTEKRRDTVDYFLDVVIPNLLELGEPEDVRIVFWFDN